MGEDTINRVPELLKMDSKGKDARPLDLFGSGLYSQDRLGEFFPGAENADRPGSTVMPRVLGSIQFVGHGENVLLVQTGTNFPLMEISEAGILRSIRLKLPTGVYIQSVLPSNKRELYVRLVDNRQKPQSQDELHPAPPNLLVVFDPDSGNALRQISANGMPLQSIACESDGSFLGFKLVPDKSSQHGEWTMVTASE
jgi:hypothetical protein